MVAVFAEEKKGKIRLQVQKSGDQGKAQDPLFYGLPASGKQDLPSMVAPLYEFEDEDGVYFYSVENEMKGMIRSENPICLVWENPTYVLTLDYKAKPVHLK